MKLLPLFGLFCIVVISGCTAVRKPDVFPGDKAQSLLGVIIDNECAAKNRDNLREFSKGTLKSRP